MRQDERTMKKEQYFLLCWLLAINILLSGMCIAMSNADSLLVCKDTGFVRTVAVLENYSSVKECLAVLKEPESTAEITSVTNFVRPGVRRRIGLRAFLLLVFVGDICRKQVCSKRYTQESGKIRIRCLVTLLNFIHKKDGKKRILVTA